MTDPTDDTPRIRTDVVDRAREVVDCTEEHIDDGTNWTESSPSGRRRGMCEYLRRHAGQLFWCGMCLGNWALAWATGWTFPATLGLVFVGIAIGLPPKPRPGSVCSTCGGWKGTGYRP